MARPNPPQAAADAIPYPSQPLMKHMLKSPILLWRLGLGRMVGTLFMILTTWGRKSGKARRTAIEYHSYQGRKYVVAAWPASDWYRNLQANPVLTIQTSEGVEKVMARRLVSDEDLSQAFNLVETNPSLRRYWKLMGFDLTREAFLQHKDRFHMLTFDATDELAPAPVDADLRWVIPLVLGIGAATWITIRAAG